jgi:tetratricopeptide (TPR) repeat protein
LTTPSILSQLLPKDIITILVSGVALVTSIIIGIINWRMQREKRSDDARKAFDDAIGAIQIARADFVKLRTELKDNFDEADALGPRAVIATRRNYATSRALQAARTKRFKLGSVDNLLLAAALIDTGRPGAAMPYYKASVDLSEDKFDKAVALRVLGRARILSGAYEDGRDEMLRAADLFGDLSGDHDYEHVRMRDEEAESYRRLIDACATVHYRNHFNEDVPAMLSAAHGLVTPIAATCRSLAAKLANKSSIPIEINTEDFTHHDGDAPPVIDLSPHPSSFG